MSGVISKLRLVTLLHLSKAVQKGGAYLCPRVIPSFSGLRPKPPQLAFNLPSGPCVRHTGHTSACCELLIELKDLDADTKCCFWLNFWGLGPAPAPCIGLAIHRCWCGCALTADMHVTQENGNVTDSKYILTYVHHVPVSGQASLPQGKMI